MNLLHQAFDGPDLALKLATNDRQVELVHIHPLVGKTSYITTIKLVAERVFKIAGDFRWSLTANDMRIEREPAVVEGAHQGVARRQPEIDFALIRGLETKAVEFDHRQQKVFLGAQRLIVDMAHIRHMIGDHRLAANGGAIVQRCTERPRDHLARP